MSGGPATITVRPARPEDLGAALDLYEAVAAEGRWIGAELPIDRAARLERWRATLERPDACFLLAFEGERPVGQAVLTGGGPSELGMLVAAEARRRGVGSALLAACIDWARAAGSHKITLQVWPHNEAAIRLYEKFGFEREGYLRRHWRRRNGEIWDALVMGLVLDAPERSDPPRECSAS